MNFVRHTYVGSGSAWIRAVGSGSGGHGGSYGSGWQLHTLSVKPKVMRIRLAGDEAVWQVYDHAAGTRHFIEWRDAMDYALAKLELVWEPGVCPVARLHQPTACHCTGACQPTRVWKAVGYP